MALSPPVDRLLVYRPGALGDFILALPALAALQAAFPTTALTVIGPAAALPLARAAGLRADLLPADDSCLTPLFAAPAAAADGAAMAGTLPPVLRPTRAVVWAGAAAAPLVARLRALGAAPVVHAASRPPPAARQHAADYLVTTLQPLGVPAVTPAVPRLCPGPDAAAAAAAFLAQQDPPPHGWLALHPGSGSPRKNWPVAQFAAAAGALAGWGLRPLLIVGPAEEPLAEAALAALHPLRPVLVRNWPLEALAALLAQCAGYIGGDSGITHLAAAVGTPVVAVFGPTDPAVWAPRGPRVTIIRRPVPCQPCSWEAMWRCPHRACLTTLAAEAVVAAAVRCFGLEALDGAGPVERAHSLGPAGRSSPPQG
ncbi:MAG TPA: glycosyltransferase family 9 protein [Chloroflexota bacterium]|nr:glycosyltransferase family 9 protein [Chloroflexota bacterium]